MIRKSLLLITLFLLGFVFGLKADKFGFNSLAFKKGLDKEINNIKHSIVVFGESLRSDGMIGDGVGSLIVFIGNWAEWLFLLYVVLVMIRMIIIYFR
ncbi:MAG: hypothetical protein ACEPO8_08360 [Rhodothermaceae bacterium]